MSSSGSRHWLRWIIAGAVVVVAVVVGGPFVYIHFVEGKAPAPLSLKSSAGPSPSGSAAGQATSAGQTASAGPVAGTWTIGSGSQVGYRVNEVLAGQNNTAVGRTKSVTGHLTIKGTSVTVATFTVPMSTIKSDQSQRDGQFDGRIMDVASYPTGTFTLTSPISLAPLPAVGAVKTYSATGNLTLHGQTRAVTFTLSAERTSTAIKVSGSIPVIFANWGIPNPSFTGFVTTDNHGVLEFLLTFDRS
jgi:polyisoprenoid-binding protein YceI